MPAQALPPSHLIPCVVVVVFSSPQPANPVSIVATVAAIIAPLLNVMVSSVCGSGARSRA